MTVVVPDRLGRRRLNRLLCAHYEKAFEGTIPWDSDDAIAAHEAIDRNYARARQLMLEHLDAQAILIVDLQERLRSLRSKQAKGENN